LWEDDEVTPVAGTAVLQALAGSKPDAPSEGRAAEKSERRHPSIDPRPSPFERITVGPPQPEREFVARMMGDAPETDPPRRGARPMSAAPPTVKSPVRTAPAEQVPPDEPPSGLLRRETMPGFAMHPSDSVPPPSSKMPPSSAKVRSGSPPPEAEGALVLDLSETMPPAAGTSRPSSGKQMVAAKSMPGSDPNRALAFGANDGGALGLVGARAESKPPKPPERPVVDLRKVRDRFDAGDFSGALVVAEGILAEDPDNSDALAYAEHCRDVLKQMYLSRLGGLRRVPVIGIGPEQLRWLSLDHRAGFLLSLVDGRSSIEELLDLSGMSDLESLRLLVQLLQQNVIRLT